MPNYKSYPTVKDTPSRKQRKAKRQAIFMENKLLNNVLRKARRIARKKAAEANA